MFFDVKYPMKSTRGFDGKEYYVEMTKDEYLERIKYFDDYRKEPHCDENGIKSYINYLNSWFSENYCDGYDCFASRIKAHKLPMSMNQYLYE